MQHPLSQAHIDAYRENGFLSGIPVFDTPFTKHIRNSIESLEDDYKDGIGRHSLNQFFRVNGQVVIPLFAEIARRPEILDKVEGVLGPDLLVWSVELFIKEPNTSHTVSWHQDLTYWGMGETDDEVTAWIALSDVSIEAGCMRFIPGSHKNGILDHRDTYSGNNLLSRGQEIADVDEDNAVFGALRPGEMSLHHGRCFHASGANRSSDRRIGLAIRYVTPEVRQPELGRDYAMLVRGHDPYQGWINIAGASRLFAATDLALYDRILTDQATVLSAGSSKQVSLYS